MTPANVRKKPLMQSRLDEVAENSVLAQLLAGFQPMQTFHQHEALAVAADQDRGLLADLQYARSDLLCLLGIERRPPLCRHVDAGDSKCLALHHWRPSTSFTAADPSPC